MLGEGKHTLGVSLKWHWEELILESGPALGEFEEGLGSRALPGIERCQEVGQFCSWVS